MRYMYNTDIIFSLVNDAQCIFALNSVFLLRKNNFFLIVFLLFCHCYYKPINKLPTNNFIIGFKRVQCVVY